ncbi:MAG: dTDP-glucose 4,6-dehydratase [Planctomycetes bacterium]|nr:dTDP-glucose 4,6-dehydratase [Planctomycetota bacterium]
MKTILVTGGAGFIGSNFVRHVLARTAQYRVVNLDLLTYAGNLENLKDVERDERYAFVKADIADARAVERVFAEHAVDLVVNFAAESHVDRSIVDPEVFVRTNVLGTQVLLDRARAAGVERYLQVSTDEVYGSLGPQDKAFTEEHPIRPSSPYSASKAGADHLVHAVAHTFGLPAVITRCSNNYGPYQFPEKLIPLMISNALEGKELPVYGDGKNVRDWLHVDDHCSAILRALEAGKAGAVYNIGGASEMENIEVVRLILRAVNRPESLIRFVKDRPGHDRRYAIDAARIRQELGWEPACRFQDGIAETVRWYLEHRDWWERVKAGEYRKYYEMMYAGR